MISVDTTALASALQALPDNPRIVVSGNHSVPWELVRALDVALARYTLNLLNAPAGIPDREGVMLETCFVGVGQRRSPRLRYIPSRLSLVPVLFREQLLVDAVLVHATPPRDGYISLGVEVNVLPAAIEACRRRGGLVVALLNDRMPFTHGDALVPVEDVDLAVEVSEPLPSPGLRAPLGDDALTIGERVASLVPHGATLTSGWTATNGSR